MAATEPASGRRRTSSSVAQGVRETMESLSRRMLQAGVMDNPLAMNATANHGGGDGAMDDEEALKWAAVEWLPTFDRVRTSVVYDVTTGKPKEVDVRRMTPLETSELLNQLMAEAQVEANLLLLKLHKRLDKVGIELPAIEVRYENLSIEADCYVGNRALPSIWNTARNFVDTVLDKLHVVVAKKAKLTILENVSGVIKPGRMTLLLGPPGSGKTTLLKALAGRLASGLRVKGEVTLNGHTRDEFVPQRTTAYISQRDLHVGEMTVRETLEFSAKCQGIGARYELLEEITRREKEAGIYPEADVDAFMKVISI